MESGEESGQGVGRDGGFLPEYSREEISRHVEKHDRWITVDGYVYDVTNWAGIHPGGEKIISGYVGHDASEAWYAFHRNKPYVSKIMKAMVIGRVKVDRQGMSDGQKIREESLLEDFHKLRSFAEDSGLFRPRPLFYVLNIAHVLLLEGLAWWILWTFGTGWTSYIIAACCLATSQVQAGWLQHDFGHRSVFENTWVNRYFQIFFLNFFKASSTFWWNFRHNNHHSKPNVIRKDPDITLAPLFLIGETIANEYGLKKLQYLPYLSQHKYFFFVMPPLLVPIYFGLEIPYFLVKRRHYKGLFWLGLFTARWFSLFGPTLGFSGFLGIYFLARVLESHWFVWVSQMSHIPMKVDYDQNRDWFTAQVTVTCNIEQSLFNDWWTGHLNFQIEHHLFPMMPRHNLVKVAPLVKSLCQKYGIEYNSKPLLKGFTDVVKSLKHSGKVWYDAYNS